MKTMNICKNCSTQLQAEQKFCYVCGTLLDTSEENDCIVECEMHPDRRAVGICVICGKPVCSDCEVKSSGKILCADPEHRILLQEWCGIFHTDSEFEADAFMRNLADGGIEAKTFSLHDHSAMHWFNENRIEVFIRKLDNEKAKALLKELHLSENN